MGTVIGRVALVENQLDCDRRGPFPRPFTIYAGNVEDVSLGVGDFAQALTNSGRRNQRRRERARRRGGTEAGSAGQPWRAQTERRTEARSSTKDYADAQDDAVNKRAGQSMEGKELAPQNVGFRMDSPSRTPFSATGRQSPLVFGTENHRYVK